MKAAPLVSDAAGVETCETRELAMFIETSDEEDNDAATNSNH